MHVRCEQSTAVIRHCMTCYQSEPKDLAALAAALAARSLDAAAVTKMADQMKHRKGKNNNRVNLDHTTTTAREWLPESCAGAANSFARVRWHDSAYVSDEQRAYEHRCG